MMTPLINTFSSCNLYMSTSIQRKPLLRPVYNITSGHILRFTHKCPHLSDIFKDMLVCKQQLSQCNNQKKSLFFRLPLISKCFSATDLNYRISLCSCNRQSKHWNTSYTTMLNIICIDSMWKSSLYDYHTKHNSQ